MNSQLLFSQILDLKAQLKTVLAPYKEALSADPEYARCTDEIKQLNQSRKMVALNYKDEFAKEIAQAEAIKEEIKLKQEALAGNLLGGASIINDTFEVNGKKYQPSLSLIFKRK